MTAIPLQLLDSPEAARRLAAAARRTSGDALAQSEFLSVLELARAQLQRDSSWYARISSELAAFRGHLQPFITREDLLALLDPEFWQTTLSVEWPRRLSAAGSDVRVEALPLGLVLHVCPGNGFETALWSMFHALLAGNQNLMRLSRRYPPVAAIVTELLVACGLPAAQVQFLSWTAERRDITRSVLDACDGAVVWGSEDTIAAFRGEVHPGTRFVGYGPRLSLGVLTVKARADRDALAGMVADACRGEQQSCSSVQCLLVEVAPGEDMVATRSLILDGLTAAFRQFGTRHPPAQKSADAQMEMLKRLEWARWRARRGDAAVASDYPDWLAIWLDDNPLMSSCLFRTLLVHPYRCPEELIAHLSRVRRYLQTVSLACAADEREEYLWRLWQAGATRVVRPGGAGDSKPGAPHEGAPILPNFLRLVSFEE